MAALARFQEEALDDKQREVYACKLKLQEEKKAALTRMEAKMVDQVSRLQQQIQKMKEQSSRDLDTTRRVLESQLTEERERANQLRETLATCKRVKEIERYISCCVLTVTRHYLLPSGVGGGSEKH